MPATRSLRPDEIVTYPDGTTNRVGIAIHFGVSLRTVDDWVAGRKIPFQRRSARMLRFKVADVQRALDKLNVREVAR